MAETSGLYGSSRVREVEHTATHRCSVISETESIRVAFPQRAVKEKDGQEKMIGKWTEAPAGNDASDGEMNELLSWNQIDPGTTLRVSPMEWKCGGWDEEHFHHQLRVPVSMNQNPNIPTNNGMVITFQALARECIAIALSPNPYFELGKSYAVHIGAAGNLQTVIRRRLESGTEAVDITQPTPQICTDQRFRSYWITYDGSTGSLSVGLGDCPGWNCVATLDDSLYHALRSGVDAVKFVGIGNSALGRKAKDLKIRNIKVMNFPNKIQTIPLKMYDPTAIDEDESSFANDNAKNKEDTALWAEYQKECEKSKARAIKFGLDYKQPPPDAFFKWSEARRLRANPEKGFITGFDLKSQEEIDKARRRKERFEEEDRKMNNKRGRDDDDDENNGMDDSGLLNNGDEVIHTDGDGGGDRGDEIKADDWNPKTREPLPMEQAWDNIDLIKEHRVDPPANLLKDDSVMVSNGGNDDDENLKPAVPVPEKIHMFAIDWAAFKQIRTDDIMAYFSIYGPSYVEWLGELSCNVHFEDKYSASRAMDAMSREIPHPNEVEFTSASSASMVIKSEEDSAMNSEEMENNMTDAVVKVEESTSPDKTSDDAPASSTTTTDRLDFGGMGWRFCNQTIRKRFSDQYGKKGTRSRCLMRVATSLDVLEERPTVWPKPPPGFTTRRVLGPGSDFPSDDGDEDDFGRRKRRGGDNNDNRRHSDGNRRRRGRNDDHRGGKRRRRSHEGSYQYDDDMETERDHDAGQSALALEEGLKSTRAGFSVEEMEAERRKQREGDAMQ